MKKIMIMIMLSLLLIAPVMAVSEGQILTQSQIDNVDIENYDFQPNWLTSKTEIILSCFVYPVGICEAKYNYLSARPETNISQGSFEKILTGNYIVRLFTKTIKFKLQKYIDIRSETSATNANQELKKYVKGKTDRQFEREKERLTELQTKQIEDAENIFGDWEF